MGSTPPGGRTPPGMWMSGTLPSHPESAIAIIAAIFGFGGIAAFVLLLLVVMAVGANWVAPYDPLAQNYDAVLDVGGYAVEGFADADAAQLRLSDLLTHLPVAVLKARFAGATKQARVRSRA